MPDDDATLVRRWEWITAFEPKGEGRRVIEPHGDALALRLTTRAAQLAEATALLDEAQAQVAPALAQRITRWRADLRGPTSS